MKFSKLVLHAALVAGVSAASVGLSASDVQAADWIIKDKSSQERPHELGILVGLPYCCGGSFALNPGVLYGIPIVDDGFVPINDSFYVEFGAWTSIRFSNPATFRLTPFGGVRWNFHLMKVWDAYAAVRMGANFGGGGPANFHFNTAVGSTWKFSEKMGLRGEFGGGNLGGNLAVGLDIDF